MSNVEKEQSIVESEIVEVDATVASTEPSQPGEPTALGASHEARLKKSGIRKARTACILIIFVAIVVGLILHLGLGTLSSLGVGAIAYICPIGALETLLAGHEIIPRLIVGLICAVVLIALLGRFFCSWVCVVPPLTKFFHPNDKKKGLKGDTAQKAVAADDTIEDSDNEKAAAALAHSCTGCAACAASAGSEVALDDAQPTKGALAPVGGKRDGLQIDSRHGVLAGALVSSLICGFPVFCLICPIGLTFALVVGIYTAIFEQNPTISLVIFAVILLIELVFFRKWCHRICPIGAFMGLVGAKAPLLKPRVDNSKCLRAKGVDCKVCTQVCPEELDPHFKDISECTKCGKCIDRCPAKAISFKAPKKRKKN